MNTLVEMHDLGLSSAHSADCHVAAIGGGEFLVASVNGLTLVTYSNGSVVVGTTESLPSGSVNPSNITYISGIGKSVVTYIDTSGNLLAAVVTVSSSVITIGTPVDSGMGNGYIEVATDGVDQVVVTLNDFLHNLYASVGTVVGDSISFGAVASSVTAKYSTGRRIVYNPDLDLYVLAHIQRTDHDIVEVKTLLVTGTTISYPHDGIVNDALLFGSLNTSVEALHYSISYDKYILLCNSSAGDDITLTMQSSGLTVTDNAAVHLGRLDTGADICYSELTDEMVHSYSLDSSELALYGEISINGTDPEVVGSDTSIGAPSTYTTPRSDWNPSDNVGAVIYKGSSEISITIFGDVVVNIPFWTNKFGQKETF